ncbi:MAG: AI-2E family transporter [Gemmatimonadetes bacterium]|nr:AI-2E family transporter [Gemmatimonadota bacterium]
MPDSVVRRITWRTSDVARVLTLIVLFLFAWQFFWKVYNAILLGFLAVLLAIVIHQPARLLARWIPFRVSFPLVVLVFIGSMIGLAVALIPQVIEQVTQLAIQLPGALDNVAAWLEERTRQPSGGMLAERINAQVTQFAGRMLSMSFNVLAALLGSFAVLVLAIFLAAQPAVCRDMFLRLVSPASKEAWERVYDEAGRNLRAWVIGKAITMVAVGIATWIGLMLFGIPGALALGTLAAVLEFIPNFGPTIAAIPAVIAAFAISPITALYVALFYFVLQQIQSAITVPLVERRAVNIPPAALLAWQLMLTIGFGFLALFVATPLLAVLTVAVRILYLEPSEERQAWDRRETAEEIPPLPAG